MRLWTNRAVNLLVAKVSSQELRAKALLKHIYRTFLFGSKRCSAANRGYRSRERGRSSQPLQQLAGATVLRRPPVWAGSSLAAQSPPTAHLSRRRRGLERETPRRQSGGHGAMGQREASRRRS